MKVDSNAITVIVPTFNRPEFCRRAVQSVKAQTQPCRIMVANDGDPLTIDVYGEGVCYFPTGRPDHWYLTCYDAVHRANTPYIAILCDDDWLEPTFLEQCVSMLGVDVAYSFCESTVHHASGHTEKHWGWPVPTGYIDSRQFGDELLRQARIMSPSFCLFRRSDILRCLLPGNVPGMNNHWMPNPSGPDHMLGLLPLLDYPRVAWICDPLVNLDGGEQSTTIQHLTGGAEKATALKQNYDNARKFYHILREAL